MKKILPLAEPVIDSFAGYAAMNHIVLQEESGQSWFVQNFFKPIVLYPESYEYVCFDYLNMDTLHLSSCASFQPESYVNWPVDTFSIPVSMIGAEEFLDFVKRQIEDEYYVMVYLNWMYLPRYGYTGNGTHEIFIYGYDDEKEEIYTTGYLPGKTYQKLTHSYQEVREAYVHMDVFWHGGILEHMNAHLNRDLNKICLLKKKYSFQFQFSIQTFLKDLKQYLHVEEVNFGVQFAICFTDEKQNMAHGNQLYDVYANYMRKCCEGQETIDLTTPYAIYNHMEGMLYKIKYMLKKGYSKDSSLEEDYEKVVKAGKAFLFTAMHYIQQIESQRKISKESGIKMQNQLLHVKTEEEVILRKLLSQLVEKQYE